MYYIKKRFLKFKAFSHMARVINNICSFYMPLSPIMDKLWLAVASAIENVVIGKLWHYGTGDGCQ